MAEESVSTIDTIRDLLRRNPFKNFLIVMSSGDRYRIEDPQAMAIGASQLFYYLPHSDKAVHIRHSQIVAVEELDERTAA
jgi:hypothetical protein